MIDSTGKVVRVTGAGRGIGAGIYEPADVDHDFEA